MENHAVLPVQAYKETMTKPKKGDVMNKMKMLSIAILAVAGLTGCASTRVAELARADAVPADEPQQVSRPAPSYGSMGGYRYRRLVTVTIATKS